jgi:hypothetical protein
MGATLRDSAARDKRRMSRESVKTEFDTRARWSYCALQQLLQCSSNRTIRSTRMIEQIQDFVSEQTAAITSQVKKLRKESTATVRDAVVDSAGNIKMLKTPVRVIARSGVKMTSVSQTAVASLIELQSDMVTSALSDVALRLERAARADGIVDLVRDQFELAHATRGRVVEDAQRAVQIFKVAGRDLKGVATHVYERIVDTAEEKAAPVAKTTKRKAKRVVRKAGTRTRARKAA